MTTQEFIKSLKELARKDKVLAKVIKQAKLSVWQPQKNHFRSLVSSIISQQLSTKAADTIEQRFVGLFGGKFPKPSAVLKMSEKKMRGAGLSFQKISYIKNIAQAVENGNLNFRKLEKATDEEVIEALTKIKGIGRWTAEMFLIFSLARPNVFSLGDLGLRNAIQKLYRIDPVLHTKKLKILLDAWHPYKSLASRHLWASLNLKLSK